jgi:hypothetical protein
MGSCPREEFTICYLCLIYVDSELSANPTESSDILLHISFYMSPEG